MPAIVLRSPSILWRNVRAGPCDRQLDCSASTTTTWRDPGLRGSLSLQSRS